MVSFEMSCICLKWKNGLSVDVVRPLLGQLVKETKTKRFIITGPEGDKLGTILRKDLKKLAEE